MCSAWQSSSHRSVPCGYLYRYLPIQPASVPDVRGSAPRQTPEVPVLHLRRSALHPRLGQYLCLWCSRPVQAALPPLCPRQWSGVWCPRYPKAVLRYRADRPRSVPAQRAVRPPVSGREPLLHRFQAAVRTCPRRLRRPASFLLLRPAPALSAVPEPVQVLGFVPRSQSGLPLGLAIRER